MSWIFFHILTHQWGMRVVYNYKNMYFGCSLIFSILINWFFTWVITVYAKIFIPIKYWHLWCYITMYIILLDFQKLVPQKKMSTLNRKKNVSRGVSYLLRKILISRICQFKPSSRMDKVKNILITKLVYLTDKQTDTLWKKKLLSELR